MGVTRMDYLILIDKFNPIPDDALRGLKLTKVNGKLVEKQTAFYLQMMLDELYKSKLDIKVLSAYRSIDYQQMLWDKSINDEISHGANYSDAVDKVSKSLAIPGASEHNLGLAVDFATPESEDTEDDFFKSPQSKWLCRNSANYGFILRYPRLKEHITGICYEPWHYRYVGTEAARLIKDNGLCLEEFLHFYQDKFFKSSNNN